jgi:hypothetical protein
MQTRQSTLLKRNARECDDQAQHPAESVRTQLFPISQRASSAATFHPHRVRGGGNPPPPPPPPPRHPPPPPPPQSPPGQQRQQVQTRAGSTALPVTNRLTATAAAVAGEDRFDDIEYHIVENQLQPSDRLDTSRSRSPTAESKQPAAPIAPAAGSKNQWKAPPSRLTGYHEELEPLLGPGMAQDLRGTAESSDRQSSRGNAVAIPAPPEPAARADVPLVPAPQVPQRPNSLPTVPNEAPPVGNEQQQAQGPLFWILRLRLPSPRGQASFHVLQIQVAFETTSSTLALCFEQAARSITSNTIARFTLVNTSGLLVDVDAILTVLGSPLVGLFVERNGVFVTLDHIVRHPRDFLNDRFLLLPVPPPPPLPPPPPALWHHLWFWVTVLCVPCVAYLIVFHDAHLLAVEAGRDLSFLVYDNSIELPLQELYRHGPWFIGWEGEPLSHICARITYHGDSNFWSRNPDECERIYAAKEEAFMRIARPVMYGVVLVFSLFALRVIVWEMARIRREHDAATQAARAKHLHPPPDREMIDTYRAFQVLLHQAGRVLGEGQRAATTAAAENDGHASNPRRHNNVSNAGDNANRPRGVADRHSGHFR